MLIAEYVAQHTEAELARIQSHENSMDLANTKSPLTYTSDKENFNSNGINSKKSRVPALQVSRSSTNLNIKK